MVIFVKWQQIQMNWHAFLDHGFHFCQMTLPHPLTLGWQNEKRPSGSTELDLEAGNLVSFCDEDESNVARMYSKLDHE